MRAVRTGERPEEESFWTSFTDVMSSIVFVLFFFIVILVIRQLVTAKVWDNRLLDADAALTGKQKQLEAMNTNLVNINRELDAKQKEIGAMESALSNRETQIDTLRSELDQKSVQLDRKEAELSDVQTQLQEISVFRLSLLNQVKDSIEEEVGSFISIGDKPLVVIDDNANLVINSSLLFAKGSSEITQNGYKLLGKFSLAFENILDDPSVRDNIDSVVITGYADSDDSYDNNYILSCERAVAVITAMMKKNPVLENTYGEYFQASGFSEFRPVANGGDEAAKSKNRRIQISINIKDSSIKDIISDYMNKK